MTGTVRKIILHLGAGTKSLMEADPALRDSGEWREIRVDVDPASKPDILASFVDLRGKVPTGSCDIVWTSHAVEHVASHEADTVFGEMRRVLKADGFAIITCPDLEAIAQKIVDVGLDTPLYTSPAGPITALDVLYGHRPSIGRGNEFMRHRTGFSARTIAEALMAAGFSEVRTTTGRFYDLWVLASGRRRANGAMISRLTGGEIDFGL